MVRSSHANRGQLTGRRADHRQAGGRGRRARRAVHGHRARRHAHRPNLEATARLAREIQPCAVFASGGMARLEDIRAVRESGAAAVVIGKALYEKAFTIEEALATAAEDEG